MTNKIKPRLWTRYFVLLNVIVMCVGISSSMLNTSMPLYLKHLGAGNSVMGLSITVFSISALLFRPVSGYFLDRKGRRLVLLAGLIGYNVLVFSYNWTFSVTLLLALRFLNGLGFSAYSTASGTVAADLVPRQRIIEGLGYYGVFQTLAFAIGPSVGLAMLGDASYSKLFIIALVLGIAGMAATFLLDYEKKETVKPAIQEKGRGRLADAFFEATAIPTAMTVFFITLTSGAVMTFLPAYAMTRGIESIGIYFTVSAPAVLATRIFSGRLVDRFGISPVLFAGMLLSGSSMVILSTAHTMKVFLAVSIINGLGTGIAFPILNSLVISLCTPERRGAANATYYSAFDLGIGAGSLLGGLFSQSFGYPLLFLVCSQCFVVSYLIYLFLVRKRMSPAPTGDVLLKGGPQASTLKADME